MRHMANVPWQGQFSTGSSGCMPARTKAPTFDGDTSQWEAFRVQFEACMAGYNDSEKARQLVLALEGKARQVLEGLPFTMAHDYDALMGRLDRRFQPPREPFMARAELRARKRKPKEGLQPLRDEIEQLVRRAHPDADARTQDELAMEAMLGAVSNAMQLKMRDKNLPDLDSMVKEMQRLELIEACLGATPASIHARVVKDDISNSSVSNLEQKMEELLKKGESLIQKLQDGPVKKTGGRTCYQCGSPDHFKRDCPQIKKKAPEQKEGNGTPPSQ